MALYRLNNQILRKTFHTSVTDRIPSPFGPKPSSIFIDKSTFLSCFMNFEEKTFKKNKQITERA